MSKDPWSYRNEGMVCKKCIFFVKKQKTGATLAESVTKEEDHRGAVGRCRRHAPTMNGFPVVFEIDWCGDHKLDENKV